MLSRYKTNARIFLVLFACCHDEIVIWSRFFGIFMCALAVSEKYYAQKLMLKEEISSHAILCEVAVLSASAARFFLPRLSSSVLQSSSCSRQDCAQKTDAEALRTAQICGLLLI